jgi:hypothetical protein
MTSNQPLMGQSPIPKTPTINVTLVECSAGLALKSTQIDLNPDMSMTHVFDVICNNSISNLFVFRIDGVHYSRDMFEDLNNVPAKRILRDGDTIYIHLKRY